ncbi:MAG TPA: restriction endonuclease subunit S [Acidobacteria bacterium]|nr:restriction endonuclease subunit S [Acidobacteriota bacterium]
MRGSWQLVPFGDAVTDESGGNVKTLQSDYLPAGRFAVVDQGKALVAGFVNDESFLCGAELPVIVFGDHTRCFKYVDFPFCMGADGVKVLRPRAGIDPKFLYFYLRQLRLPDGGYDRHFKYLKRSAIPLPPLPEQQRIADVLDRVEALRAKRRAALAQLDGLTQAIFLEMFGGAAARMGDWPMMKLQDCLASPLRNGLSPSTAGRFSSKVLTLSAITGPAFDSTAWKACSFQTALPVSSLVDATDFLICRGNGSVRLVGKGQYPSCSMEGVAFPDTMIAARISPFLLDRAFFQHVWNSGGVRRQLEASARTTNGTFKINQTAVECVTLEVPPLPLQQDFARRVAAVEKLKAAHRASLGELDALFASLQHRAFRGEL